MKVVSGVIFGLFLLCILACGGGGGGGGGQNVLITRHSNMLAAWEDEDIDDLIDFYSVDFYDNCIDLQDLIDELEASFDQPNVTYEFVDVDYTNTEFEGNFALLQGNATFVINDDGDITEEPIIFSDVFRKEDGVWMIYGNQECDFTPQDASKQPSLKKPSLAALVKQILSK